MIFVESDSVRKIATDLEYTSFVLLNERGDDLSLAFLRRERSGRNHFGERSRASLRIGGVSTGHDGDLVDHFDGRAAVDAGCKGFHRTRCRDDWFRSAGMQRLGFLEVERWHD